MNMLLEIKGRMDVARALSLTAAFVWAIITCMRFLSSYLMQTAFHILLSIGFALASRFHVFQYRSPKRVHNRRFAVFAGRY